MIKLNRFAVGPTGIKNKSAAWAAGLVGTILSLLLIPSCSGFAVHEAKRFGGRQPSQPDKFDPSSQTWEPDPLEDGECRLIICQITDVYTLYVYLAKLYTWREKQTRRFTQLVLR